MRRYIGVLCILMSTIFSLGSCLSSNDTEVTLYDDAAITSFGISTAKLHVQTPDTTYWTTTTDVANYPFEIDHAKGTIVNRDSMPVGIDATKMLVSYSSKNSSTVGIMPIGETSRDSMKYLLTTDSLDFSTPRTISVYASDGSGYRDYTVTVLVHKEYGDSCYWSKPITNADIAKMTQAKALCIGDSIWVIGTDGTATSVVGWDRNQPSSPASTIATALSTVAYKNVAAMGSNAYILDSGKILATSDFKSYSEVATTSGLKQLVGAGSSSLYAIDDSGNLVVSRDNGATWTSETLDDEANLLPTEEISTICTTYPAADDCDYMILAGNRNITAYPSDTNAKVWRKIDTNSSPKWVYIDFDSSNKYPLKQASSISLMKYGDSILEMGKTDSGYTGILESRDGGITWKTNKYISLPDDFDGTSTSYAVATADSQDMIWIVKLDTGEVWKGRQNKMGWANK